MRVISILISFLLVVDGFSQDVFLKGKYVHLGVHTAGSFGTANKAPSGYYTKGSSNLGFVCDIDKDGFNKGNPNFAGDYFIPGSPEEGWGIQWRTSKNGAKRNFNNFGLNNEQGVKTISHSKEVQPGSQRANWIGSAESGKQKVAVQQTVILDSLSQHFSIEVLIKNTGTDTIYKLDYFRNVDPDNEQTLTGNFSTSNYVIHQPGVGGNKDKAMVMAKGLKYGIPCILGAIDTRAKVSIGGFAVRSPDHVFSYNKTYTQSNPFIGDVAISLAFSLGDLPPGKCVTFVYFYALQSVVPNSKSFRFSLKNAISADAFRSREILGSRNICLADTIVEIKTSAEGSGVDFIDEILWDTDNNDTFDAYGDSIKVTFRGYKKHSIKQRITFCDGSFVDSVYHFEIVPKPIIKFGFKIKEPCFNEHLFEVTNNSVLFRDSIKQWNWILQDSLLSQLKSPTDLKAKAFTSNYTLKLIGISENGCLDSNQINFKLLESPGISVTVMDTAACFRGNSFSANVTGAISKGLTRSIMNWGDGTSDTSTNILLSHSYLKYGSYHAHAQVISDSGCATNDTVLLKVYPQPQSRIIATDTILCLRSSTFNFQENTLIDTGTLDFKWWSNVDSRQVEDTVFQISPSKWGIYQVFLSSVSHQGCGDTISRNVFTAPNPKATYSFNDSTQCLKGNQFVLDDNSTCDSGALSRSWLFPTKSDTASRFTYKKLQHGRDFGMLISKSSFGCADTLEITYRIFPQSEISISILKDSQCLNQNRFKVENTSTNQEAGIKKSTWNWNQEYVAEGIFSEYVFSSYGIKEIQLITESDQGCLDSLQDSVYVLPQSNVGFTLNNTKQCVKGNLFLTGNTSSIPEGTLSYSWSINDSLITYDKNMSHVIPNWGLYNLKLKTKSDFGCLDSLVKQIEVHPQTTLDIKVNQPNQCLRGNLFDFVNNSRVPKGTSTYSWDFGESMSSNVYAPPKVSYKTYGEKVVGVISVTNNNCRDTIKLQVRVNDQPKAKFEFLTLDSCEKYNRFQLTDLTELQEGSFERTWKYEGSLGQKDSIVQDGFKSSGYKEVTLKVQSGEGCVDSLIIGRPIHPSPTISYTVDPIICQKSDLLSTTNTSTVSSGTMAFKWLLSNGEEFLVRDITNHRLMDTGRYQLNLIGTSDKFCSDTSTTFFEVVPNTYLSLDDFNEVLQCFKYNRFDFKPKNKKPNVAVIQNTWIWGDGTMESGFEASHSYGKSGEYLVRMLTSNTLGCTDTLTKAVEVLAPIEFIVAGDTVCFPEKNTLVSNSKSVDDPIVNHVWAVQGGVGVGREVQMAFPSAGTYSGILSVKTARGCVDSFILRDIVTVLQKPKADFEIDSFKTLGTAMQLKLTNNASADVTDWNYTFDFGQTSNSSDPSFIFTDTGDKSVYLIVTATNGCMDTIEKIMGPFYPAYFQHVPNVFTPNQDNLNERFIPVVSAYIQRYEFRVYNKWGQLLFYSEDPNLGWDGRYQDNEVQDDSYFYTLHIVDLKGKRHVSKGHFLKK